MPIKKYIWDETVFVLCIPTGILWHLFKRTISSCRLLSFIHIIIEYYCLSPLNFTIKIYFFIFSFTFKRFNWFLKNYNKWTIDKHILPTKHTIEICSMVLKISLLLFKIKCYQSLSKMLYYFHANMNTYRVILQHLRILSNKLIPYQPDSVIGCKWRK